ncbi:MAG: class I SAM-dependent methyltransferase [Thermaurantiacus sp.]
MRMSLALLFAVALAAPASGQHAHDSQTSAGHAGHAVEMNRRWMAPDVDVADWTRRFENPERDVIANRAPIVAALRLRPGQTVADVGAGTGAYLAALSSAVGEGGRVLAVDISPAFVSHMAARAEAEGLGNVAAILGSADDPMLPQGGVDVILSVNTFHHFEAPEAMLKAMHRALTPGGQLAIVDFDREAAGATEHQRAMAPLDKAAHVRLIEAHGFRLVEDVAIATLRQNFMLRFVRE